MQRDVNAATQKGSRGKIKPESKQPSESQFSAKGDFASWGTAGYVAVVTAGGASGE